MTALEHVVCERDTSFVCERHVMCVWETSHMLDSWYDSFMCAVWLIHMCDMTHSYVWHDSFIWDTTHVGHDSSVRDLTYSYVSHYLLQMTVEALERVMSSARSATQLQHHCNSGRRHARLQSAVAAGAAEGRLCGMTRSCVWRDSFMCVAWLIHSCRTRLVHMWPGAFVYVAWRIHVCDMAYSYIWHGSFMYVTWLIHICDMALALWHDSLSTEK